MLGTTPILGDRPHAASDYRAAVRSIDVRKAGALTIAPAGDLAATRTANDAVLAIARESRGRFFAVASVHPADGALALAEVDRVATDGAVALKLHPNTQEFDVADPAVQAVVARAAARGLPVLFDAYSPFDANQPGKFVRLAMSVPSAKLILAHAHGPRFPDLLVYEILARYPWWRRNVWIDLSATGPLLSGSPFAASFLWVVRKVGIDRWLFGSDYPLDDPISAVRRVAALGFTPVEARRVFYENARELFGFALSRPAPRSARRPRRRRNG
jgi:predicted TIM-barrel fold metal-dependent hydrolase